MDTSALIAILTREAAYKKLIAAIMLEDALLPAPAFVELHRAVSRKPEIQRQDAEELVNELFAAGLRLLPFTAEHAGIADQANERYGIGVAPRGTLNLLDLMVYACAKVERRPILCTGRDFAATDAVLHPASRTTA